MKGQHDKTKSIVLNDGGKELTKQFSEVEDFVIQTAQKRKQSGSGRCMPILCALQL